MVVVVVVVVVLLLLLLPHHCEEQHLFGCPRTNLPALASGQILLLLCLSSTTPLQMWDPYDAIPGQGVPRGSERKRHSNELNVSRAVSTCTHSRQWGPCNSRQCLATHSIDSQSALHRAFVIVRRLDSKVAGCNVAVQDSSRAR